MIIATIGSSTFKIGDMEDAENLLRILSRSEPLEESYNRDYQEYFHPASGKQSIIIKITTGEIVSVDEHKKIQTERNAAREAKAVEAKVPA